MILSGTNINLETNASIIVGQEAAYQLLIKLVDTSTLLLLSGGTTPKWLYEQIAKRSELVPGAVALIDERYGAPLHQSSNELMIKTSGLPQYLESRAVLYARILCGKSIEQTTADYEVKLHELFSQFPKRVAVMGVGDDGHTAGLLPDIEYNQIQDIINYASKDQFDARITLTFAALEQLDIFVVLLFGERKRLALSKLLDAGNDRRHIPAAFYSQTKKAVFLYTDITPNS